MARRKEEASGAKTIAEDRSESLRSSGPLSSVETSSESITRTCGVAAMVMIFARGPRRCGVARIGILTIGGGGGFRLTLGWGVGLSEHTTQYSSQRSSLLLSQRFFSSSHLSQYVHRVAT